MTLRRELIYRWRVFKLKVQCMLIAMEARSYLNYILQAKKWGIFDSLNLRAWRERIKQLETRLTVLESLLLVIEINHREGR